MINQTASRIWFLTLMQLLLRFVKLLKSSEYPQSRIITIFNLLWKEKNLFLVKCDGTLLKCCENFMKFAKKLK